MENNYDSKIPNSKKRRDNFLIEIRKEKNNEKIWRKRRKYIQKFEYKKLDENTKNMVILFIHISRLKSLPYWCKGFVNYPKLGKMKKIWKQCKMFSSI